MILGHFVNFYSEKHEYSYFLSIMIIVVLVCCKTQTKKIKLGNVSSILGNLKKNKKTD